MADKILGKYTLLTSLYSFIDSFTFTGNNRNTELQLSADEIRPIACGEVNSPVNKNCLLLSNNILRIEKARIITLGAAGLRPSLSAKAATLFFTAFKENDVYSQELGSFSFELDFFNEWQDINLNFLPDFKNADEHYYLGLKAISVNKLTLDDYNIQTAYIGQSFRPELELKVDTAGVYSTLLDEVF